MNRLKGTTFIILLLMLLSGLYPLNFPRLNGRVNDYAGILSSHEEINLENLLADLENRTTAQFVILTIPDLQGTTIEDYSIRLTEQKEWKIGQKGVDNGVILLISMKEKKLRIEVGYGLEGSLTDLKCSYIIRELIVPYFKKGDFFKGILNGATTISGIISKETDISPEELKRFKKRGKRDKPGTFIFIMFLLIFFILPAIFRGRGRGRGSSIFWGGGFGGGSGGGFGGFSGGGGSFGGGGASGGW